MSVYVSPLHDLELKAQLCTQRGRRYCAVCHSHGYRNYMYMYFLVYVGADDKGVCLIIYYYSGCLLDLMCMESGPFITIQLLYSGGL